MSPDIKAVPCPICKAKVARDAAHFPFCSKRCQTIDLGNWASNRYTIPSPLPDDDMPDDETFH